MATASQLSRINARHRRSRQDLGAFAALIETPHDLGVEPVVLPANARLAVSSDNAEAAGDVTVTVKSTVYATPALVADAPHRLNLAERGWEVDVDGPVGSTITLHVVGHFGEHVAIATKVL